MDKVYVIVTPIQHFLRSTWLTYRNMPLTHLLLTQRVTVTIILKCTLHLPLDPTWLLKNS